VEYTFTLKYQLSDQDADQQELVERLLGGGCDDALIGVGRPGRIALQFDREAESAREALLSALADVQRIIPSATLIEASPDLVGLTDVADVVGITRQGIRKLATTHASIFPAPVHEGSTALWHLADVLKWMKGRGAYDISSSTQEIAGLAMQVNLHRDGHRIDHGFSEEIGACLREESAPLEAERERPRQF
jgi:hypothetical protein